MIKMLNDRNNQELILNFIYMMSKISFQKLLQLKILNKKSLFTFYFSTSLIKKNTLPFFLFKF